MARIEPRISQLTNGPPSRPLNPDGNIESSSVAYQDELERFVVFGASGSGTSASAAAPHQLTLVGVAAAAAALPPEAHGGG